MLPAVRWAEGHGSSWLGVVRLVGLGGHRPSVTAAGCKGNSLKASTKILEKHSSIGLNYESEKEKAICYYLCMILPAYLLCFRLNLNVDRVDRRFKQPRQTMADEDDEDVTA